MKTTLVGCTGFVGSNLAASHGFTYQYHSTDIQQAMTKEHDLVVYAGVRAEKFLANERPQQDRAMIHQAFDTLVRMKPKKVVLISTIDVYAKPNGADENAPMTLEGLQAYGRNRLELEELVRGRFDSLIVRLPALFGKGLKKNFLFDAITLVPSMLKPDKYEELAQKSDLVARSYALADNGYYRLSVEEKEQRRALREFFRTNDWNALYFTDSRNVYQFYDLSRLWDDIRTALQEEIPVLNLTSEPLCAADLYEACFDGSFTNVTEKEPVRYDLRSCYADRYGGQRGYTVSKEETLRRIRRFVEDHVET